MSVSEPLRHGDPARLYFFFDFISHNAWLAWNAAQQFAQRHGLVFEPVPVVFGVMLKANGQLGPAEVPPKLRWMLWNVLRKAKLHKVPIAPPHRHPFNPLLSLRLACCELPPAQKLQLIDRIFRATWAESRDVTDIEVLRELVREIEFDEASLLQQLQTDVPKLRLRQHTDDALADGVFGVPTMIARGELFWGFDDLQYCDQFLQGNDPLDADRSTYEAWQQVQPGVQRKR